MLNQRSDYLVIPIATFLPFPLLRPEPGRAKEQVLARRARQWGHLNHGLGEFQFGPCDTFDSLEKWGVASRVSPTRSPAGT